LLSDDPERWGKSLAFFRRIDECEACRQLLKRAGLRAEVVTGKSERERQLEAFENDRIDVLLNVAVLTEGFDCPSLHTVFCRPSGRGCTIQMAGRVFRKHPLLPVKQVVQCRETRHPFTKTATPREQFIQQDGSWAALTPTTAANVAAASARRFLSRRAIALPDFVRLATPARPPWAIRGG
jgi:hypothetical protein